MDLVRDRAWATLLTDPAYEIGVRTLAASLREARTRFPLVAMVTSAIDADLRERLRAEGIRLRDVAPLAPRADSRTNYAFTRFAEVWTKLRAWELTEFSRVVFLDADMLVLQNMDELFEMPLPPGEIAASPACVCNPHRFAHYPASWRPENCRYGYPTEVAPPADVPNYFNSGLLVLTPNRETFDLLRTRLEENDLSRLRFPDQDLLNEHFAGRWHELPYVYNALKTISHAHADRWKLAEIKNLHFILEKPWETLRRPLADRDPRYTALDERWAAVAERAGIAVAPRPASSACGCGSTPS